MNDTNTGNKLAIGGVAKLQRLQQVHKDIIRMYLLGMKYKDIAKQLGITQVAVSYTLSSPLVQAELKEKNDILDDQVMIIKSRIEELKPLALDTLNKILIDDNASYTVKRATAMDILDTLGGESVPHSVTVNNNLTINEINDLKSRALSAAKAAGILAVREEGVLDACVS